IGDDLAAIRGRLALDADRLAGDGPEERVSAQPERRGDLHQVERPTARPEGDALTFALDHDRALPGAMRPSVRKDGIARPVAVAFQGLLEELAAAGQGV